LRRVCILVLAVLLLGGCAKGEEGLESALAFRDKLLQASECTFDCVITADYGDEIHVFSLRASVDPLGDLSFEVIEPEVISGISGVVGDSATGLTFDDKVLAFPLLADGQLAPVGAPWVLMKALRSGYISFVGKEGEHWRSTVLDSYEDDAMVVDVWFDEDWCPVQGEILFKEVKILTLTLENFQML